jgi:DNA-binding PadR family transcriptional regulator
MESNGLIERSDEVNGKRRFAIYRPTIKGMRFCNEILEVFEKMFPRNPMGEHEQGT